MSNPKIEKKQAPLAKFLLEGRWAAELSIFSWNFIPLQLACPRGDGHPVLVLPGFTAGDWSTKPLRLFLEGLGYKAYGWEQGTNTGPSAELMLAMEERLDALYQQHGCKVSLVGWSLGGIYARELARRFPEKVRQVMTLGSPYGAEREHVHAALIGLLQVLKGKTFEELHAEFLPEGDSPPPVPCTSVYSKTDGVADWTLCIEDEPDATHQNIQVYGAHTGLGWNTSIAWLLADRLAQPEDDWKKFEPTTRAERLSYPNIS